MVAGLHICDTLTNGLDDAGTLVSQDDRESTLGVLSGECVGIGMTDTSVVDLDADFVGFGGRNLDVLNHKVLASLPGNCGLLISVSLGLVLCQSTLRESSPCIPCK